MKKLNDAEFVKVEKALAKINIPMWIVRNLIEKNNCYVKNEMDSNENLYVTLQEIFGNNIVCEAPQSCEGYILRTNNEGIILAKAWIYSKCGVNL